MPVDGSFSGVDGTLCSQDDQCVNMCVDSAYGTTPTCRSNQERCDTCAGSGFGHSSTCRTNNGVQMGCAAHSPEKCSEETGAQHGAYCEANSNCYSQWCADWAGADFRKHCAGAPGQHCWTDAHTTASMGVHCYGDSGTHVNWCAGDVYYWWGSTSYCAGGTCSTEVQSGRRLQGGIENATDYASIYAAMFNVSVEVYLRGSMLYSHGPDNPDYNVTFQPGPPLPPPPSPPSLPPPPSPPSPPPLACSHMQNRFNTVLLNTTTYNVKKNLYDYVFCFHLDRSTHDCNDFFSMTANNFRMRACFDPGYGSFCEASEAITCDFLPPAPPPLES